MRSYKAIILGLLLVGLSATSWADPPIETVVRAKQATALVDVEEVDGTAEGSAFCIDASGLFITNAHVVEDLKPGGKLILVLHSGEADQVKMPANVIKMDKLKDLAVLQAAHPRNLTPLTLGNTSGLIETMSVVAFGYPFGKDLALKDGDFPSISVSTGHITALRKIDGDLASIQLDASLNEGNSGGPIIDSKGEVIAIVMEGIPGSGINMAIPVSYLRSFLNSLNIVFTPPIAKAGHLRDKQIVKIELLNQQAGKERAVVEITMSTSEADKRTVKAETDDGRNYIAEISLLRNLPTDIPTHVSYEIKATKAGKVIATEEGKISLQDAITVTGGSAPSIRAARELVVSCLDSNDIRRFDAGTGEYLGSFATGNGLRGPQDMMFGADGTLYVCTAYTNSVKRYNGRTGQYIDSFVADGSGGLNNAHSMDIGPDGNLYICSHWTKEVKCYNGKTGAFLGNFIAGAGGMDRPSSLAFSSDGFLYVSCYTSNTIKRYNARTGEFVDDFIGGNGLKHPGSFTWGPDHNLYVCSESNEVKRYNGKTGEFISNFITRETGGLDTPLSLTFGPNGKLYVGDKTSTIKRFDSRTGAFIDVFAGGNGMVYPMKILLR